VPLPVSSVCVVGLPPSRLGSASRQWSAGNDFVRAGNLGAADIALCSGLPVCVPPRLSVPPRKRPQGSRGFYVRAEPASPLPQAPDMPTVRIQAIDSTGTFTLLDSQPCRLLTFALRTLLRFIATTNLAATVSPSVDFPVDASYTTALASADFSVGTRTVSPVARFVLVIVPSLPPRRSDASL